MRYGSVCSGIEAASVAWESLGWKAAWFAEIEAFPSAVLAHHWPDVVNLGDMTGIAGSINSGDVEAPEILVGGTPCQAFSVAGLRNGLDDARGQLTLSYVELANAIDDKRRKRGEEEAIFVWENVPGVLSSKDNAFGCFLAGLAGESCELQSAGGKWTNAGCVSGPERVIAWRVIDAQFLGVAQRRKRVFVVASAREGFDPAAVLFELESVRRDSPPSREPQTAIAALTANGVGTCGADDNQAQAGHLQPVVGTISAHSFTGGVGGGPEGAAAGHFIPVGAYRMTAFGEYADDETASTCKARDYKDATDLAVMAFPERMSGMQVRRLTPRECERLQGFPDDHTLVPYGKGTSPEKMDRDFAKYLMRGGNLTFEECCGRAADGHRYRAIGNSMAVPVMHWIGERINSALKIAEPEAPARTWLRPFLKWAGGKYSLLGELDKHIPAGLRLIEPFVGGGSVFLNSDKHANFLLADSNPDLINLYQMLAVVPAEVIGAARLMFTHLNTAEDFAAIKAEFNDQLMDTTDRAAAFLYLNRHCFNGLMRYNRNDQFNVGWGKYTAPYFPENEIKAFTEMAHNCVFLNAGFRRTLALAGDGDVVYCDPPYEPLPGTNGFTAYTAGGFNWDEQIALAECCVAAHQRGARVVISNSTAPRIIELYEQHSFTLHHVSGRRSISSKGSTRTAAKDLVAIL